MIRFLDVAGIKSLRPPTWLVEGIIPEGGLVEVYGSPGSGKTFLMIDIALSIASGRDWNSSKVRRGPVYYVAAEGINDMKPRLEAWQDLTGVADNELSPRFTAADGDISMLEDEFFIELGKRLQQLDEKPSLIVFDTFARVTPGVDENSAKEVGLVVKRADMLRNCLNCTVVFIHHSNKSDTGERGSTVVRGAADTMISVSVRGSNLTVSCSKQRSWSRFDPMSFCLMKHRDSCVLTLQIIIPAQYHTSPKRETQLETIKNACKATHRISKKELKTLLGFTSIQSTHKTFPALLKKLEEDGMIIVTHYNVEATPNLLNS